MNQEMLSDRLVDWAKSQAQHINYQFWIDVQSSYRLTLEESGMIPNQKSELRGIITTMVKLAISEHPGRNNPEYSEYVNRLESYRHEAIGFVTYLGEGNVVSPEIVGDMTQLINHLSFSPVR